MRRGEGKTKLRQGKARRDEGAAEAADEAAGRLVGGVCANCAVLCSTVCVCVCAQLLVVFYLFVVLLLKTNAT